MEELTNEIKKTLEKREEIGKRAYEQDDRASRNNYVEYVRLGELLLDKLIKYFKLKENVSDE